MRVLHGRLLAHGVDLEMLVHRVLHDAGPTLSADERDDAFAHLIEAAWRLARKSGDPDARGPERQRAFSTGAYRHLRYRSFPDWQRRRFGRRRWKFAGSVYERELPEIVSLGEVDAVQYDVPVTERDRFLELASIPRPRRDLAS